MTPIKKRADLKKTVLKILTKSLPDAKLHIADTEPEIQLILRMVSIVKTCSGLPVLFMLNFYCRLQRKNAKILIYGRRDRI